MTDASAPMEARSDATTLIPSNAPASYASCVPILEPT